MWNTELWGKRYKTSGRIGRLDYFKSQLFLFAITSGLYLLNFLTLSKALGYISFAYVCIYVWLSFCLALKRLHDIGLSGWVLLGLFILVSRFTLNIGSTSHTYSILGFLLGDVVGYYISQGIGILSLIALYTIKGTRSDNKYGKSLRAEEA